jgi:hypothetical protein
MGSLSSHPSIFVKTGSFGSYPGAIRKELAVYGHTKDHCERSIGSFKSYQGQRSKLGQFNVMPQGQRKEQDGLMSHLGPLKGVGQFCVMSGTVQMASGSFMSYQGH